MRTTPRLNNMRFSELGISPLPKDSPLTRDDLCMCPRKPPHVYAHTHTHTHTHTHAHTHTPTFSLPKSPDGIFWSPNKQNQSSNIWSILFLVFVDKTNKTIYNINITHWFWKRLHKCHRKLLLTLTKQNQYPHSGWLCKMLARTKSKKTKRQKAA